MRLNRPPSEKAIARASKYSPCSGCVFVKTCDYMVKTLGVDPLCFATSEDHDKYLEVYDSFPNTRKWKREIEI